MLSREVMSRKVSNHVTDGSLYRYFFHLKNIYAEIMVIFAALTRSLDTVDHKFFFSFSTSLACITFLTTLRTSFQ